MIVWRLCRAKHEASAFTGHGAELTGGRWNHKGHAMVYSSENLSLAVLELFVHVSPGIMPADLVSIRATLPDSISTEELSEKDLPKGWRTYPAPGELKSIGTNWIKGKTSLALLVPSAINAVERNILLNPAHPEMALLKVEKSQPFRFDPRMFGRQGSGGKP